MTMMQREPVTRVAVLIPTYNERDNLPGIVARVRANVPAADVFVLDDSSPDGTGEIADAIAATDPQVRVVHRAAKEGLGQAYLAGFAIALDEGYDAAASCICLFGTQRCTAGVDKGVQMAWSWVRVKTGTSQKLRDCMGSDASAGKFVTCVETIVAKRNGRVDDVKFEPNGRWARVRFWWENPQDRLAILLDLEAEEVHDLLSAEEMDELRLRG